MHGNAEKRDQNFTNLDLLDEIESAQIETNYTFLHSFSICSFSLNWNCVVDSRDCGSIGVGFVFRPDLPFCGPLIVELYEKKSRWMLGSDLWIGLDWIGMEGLLGRSLSQT